MNPFYVICTVVATVLLVYLVAALAAGYEYARHYSVRRRQDRPGSLLSKQGGQDIYLTPIEYRLLTVLVANAGRVVTNPQLLREVWGPSHSESSHYLRVYIRNLRQKLEQDPAQPCYFLTKTAIGYRLLIPL